MARLRIETAPEITVYDEAFVIKAAANATAPLIQLKNSSGTVVGNISSDGTLNVASVVAANAGTSSTDLATRAYVDTVASGMNWHAAADYATAAALPACTYANGTLGVNATLTGNSDGRLTVDGVAQTTNKSILVKNQADAKQNGIYYITAQGVDGSAPFVLTRRSDTDNSIAGQVKAGDAVYVTGGSNNGGQAFTLTSTGTGTRGTIIFGTDSLTYTQFTGTATFTAGAGLLATGNVVDIGTASVNRIVINANDIDLATVTQTNTAGSNTTSFISSHTVDSYGRIIGTETSSVSFAGYATLASPALTGAPTSTTAANGTSNTQIATTAFVNNAVTQSISDAGNNAILKSLVDAKGDLVVGTADNTVARIGVGSNNTLLRANSSTSTGLEWGNISPVITLGGDLTGNVTLTNLGNATLTATIEANSVVLGTDTTGNYMVDVSAGTGISVSHTPNEGSTATLSINTAVTADLTTSQTLANKTFTTPNIGAATGTSLVATGSGGLTTRVAATQDGVAITGRAGGTGTYSVTLTPATLSANRTITLPDVAGTVVTTGSSLTSSDLLSILSDETGTGLAVFNTSPNINTSITTSSATFNLVNTNVTALNFAGSATTLAIGNTAGNTTLNGNVVVGGNFTVNGTNTVINANTLVISDKNIEMANIAVQTNTSADGGGILLHGATDKSFYWYDASKAWTSSEHMDLVSGKEYKINNTTVLTSTQVLGKAIPSGTIVGTSDTQVLSNKTFTGGITHNGATSGSILLKAADVAGTTTITLPATTGTVVTTGDSGTITGTMIADNTIVNADIATTAAIAYSKLSLTTSIVNGDISATAANDQSKIADTVINPQTTSYTLILTDKNKMVEVSNAGATTLTIPADNTVNMATGATLTILQTGAGQVTLAGASGVTVTATPGLKLRTQWSSATLIKRAANTWIALGDLSA
jgi:hypothetical protein